MAETFGVSDRFSFTFQPEHAAQDVEILTREHRVLDHMVQYAQRRGRSCSVIFLGSHWNETVGQAAACNPWRRGYHGASPQIIRMMEKLRPLRFHNARQRIIHRRALYQRQALFRFRVAFCGDEKREMMFAVFVDPVTEAIDSTIDISGGIAMPAVWRGRQDAAVQRMPSKLFPTYPFRPRKTWMSKENSWRAGETTLRHGNAYVWFRLYRKACEYLECQIETERRRFQAEAAARLAVEKTRLDEYYRGLAAETVDPLRRVFRRMAAAEMRMGWAGDRSRGEQRWERLRTEALRLREQYAVELKKLETERERRLEELLERYRIKTEITLAQVALVYVPRIAWTLRLTGTGPSRREITVLYDILRERIVEPRCDACESVLTDSPWLSCCGDVVCRTCGMQCPTCGDTMGKSAENSSILM